MQYEVVKIKLPATKMTNDDTSDLQDRLNKLADGHQEVVATFVDQGSDGRQLIVIVK